MNGVIREDKIKKKMILRVAYIFGNVRIINDVFVWSYYE